MKPVYEARRAGSTIFRSETLGAFWQRSRVYVKSATRSACVVSTGSAGVGPLTVQPANV